MKSKHGRQTIFSTSIYGISVTFADVITGEIPIALVCICNFSTCRHAVYGIKCFLAGNKLSESNSKF